MNAAPSLSAAIFDIDGTLLDSMTIWHDVSTLYLRRRGIEPPPSLVDKIFTMTLYEGCEYIKSLYNFTETVDELIEAVLSVMRDFYRYDAQFKSGAHELLRALHERGIPFALATAGERETHESALSRLGVLDMFAHRLYCSELSTSKREPTIYLCAADKLGYEPQNIAVFEDALYAVRTAKSAGFYTVGVADASQTDDERNAIIREADEFVYDLCDLDINIFGGQRK